jgi:hypothetical protein
MSRTVFVDPLSTTSLRVTPRFGDVALASATAFTTLWEGKTYLVSNWHVFSGRDADTNDCLDKRHASLPDRLEVHFHKNGSLGLWETHTLPLIDEHGKSMWCEHPLGSRIDVAALEVPASLLERVSCYPLDLSLATTDMRALPAHPVSVIGFPLGLTAGGNWPIWKTGHIASDPDIDYEVGRPAFLIDATTRSGMSGSPVVLRLDNYQTQDGGYSLAGGFQTKFLGIYAGRIHEQSEIGRVWRPHVVSELLRHSQMQRSTTLLTFRSQTLV